MGLCEFCEIVGGSSTLHSGSEDDVSCVHDWSKQRLCSGPKVEKILSIILIY